MAPLPQSPWSGFRGKQTVYLPSVSTSFPIPSLKYLANGPVAASLVHLLPLPSNLPAIYRGHKGALGLSTDHPASGKGESIQNLFRLSWDSIIYRCQLHFPSIFNLVFTLNLVQFAILHSLVSSYTWFISFDFIFMFLSFLQPYFHDVYPTLQALFPDFFHNAANT